MIRFMVLAAPRSGTCWAANWLGAAHDPLWDHYYEDLDRELDCGIACTGLALMPQWVSRHPCPKVILHRPVIECEASLRVMGIPSRPMGVYANLHKIAGLHVDWMDLFNNPEPNWEHVKREPFDRERHEHLKNVNIQSDWRKRLETSNPSVRERMLRRGIVIAR